MTLCFGVGIFFSNLYSSPFNTFMDTLGRIISDGSIRAGLEHNSCLEGVKILTSKETEALGLHGTMVLLDGGLILMLALILISLF